MKIINAIAILISCIILSCKEPKQAAVTPAPKPVPQPQAEIKAGAPAIAPVQINLAGSVDAMDEPVMDAEVVKLSDGADPIMPFIVSFYSIGTGIDRGESEKLLSFIEAFGKKRNGKIEYTVTHWGKEGETDYCFPLFGFPDSGISDFKIGAKNALKSAEHVHFIENEVCRKGR